MKDIKIFVVMLFIYQLIFSQPYGFREKYVGENLLFSDQVFYSFWINPIQYDENLIFNYHIRYDFLLFEKTQPNKPITDTFQAKIKVMIELSSSDLLIPIRKIEQAIIKTTEFKQTISTNLYYSSNFSLKVLPKRYNATFTIFDEIRNKEYSVPSFEIDLADNSNFELIFIKESDIRYISSQDLKNKFYNFLPFSSEKFVLLLPDEKEFEKIKIDNKFVSYKLKRNENTGLRYSVFSTDSLNLIEGKYTLSLESKSLNSKEFLVRWLDKPLYIKNLNNAIEIMKYLFENDRSLNRYFVDKDELIYKFYEKWKKFDPTPSTPFNELMFEFYKRADYASLEFKSPAQPDGALTDRGKIYMIYGPPSNIERSFAKDGRAIEVWTYNSNKNLTFTFFDENKNGNYILRK